VAELLDDALFGPDGTQPLAPWPVLPDPLAGLVTGETLAGGADGWFGGLSGLGGFGELDRQPAVRPSTSPPLDAQPMRAEDRSRVRRRPAAPARPRTSPAVQPTFASSPILAAPYSFGPAPVAPRPSAPTAPTTAAPRRRRRGRGWLGVLVVVVVIGALRYGGAIANLLTRLLHH
jgi:hypothetical protein